MTPHVATASDGTDVLGLRSVLAGSLPPTLGTPDAPERYTVEAVFSRRPESLEVRAMTGAETRRRLADAGYPLTELSVTDRRLEIAGTNLDDLRDGLGRVLADLLAHISQEIRRDRVERAAALEANAARELDRAADIARLAATVTFDRSEGGPR